MAKSTTLKLPNKNIEKFLNTSKGFLLGCNERSRLIVTTLRSFAKTQKA